jgi:hypothetical protein
MSPKPYSKYRSFSQDFYMNYSLFFIFTFCSHLYINVLLKELLTGFLYELRPSLHTYTLLLPVYNWICFTEDLNVFCISTCSMYVQGLYFIWQLSFPTTTLQQVGSSLNRLCWYGSGNEQLLDQNTILYATSCSQHAMGGQNTPHFVLTLTCPFIYMSTKHEVTDKFPAGEWCLLVWPA